MNIGIDIDDTINNLHELLIRKAIEFNIREKIEHRVNENAWHWDKAFGWDDRTAKKFLEENMENIYLNAGIKENAANIINKLHTEGNKIVIITARGPEHVQDIYKTSETWLRQKNVVFDKLIVNSKDKTKTCIENNIDIFIDDHVDFCEGVSTTKAKVFMFDSPYNREETRYKRVYSWDEIYKVINE